MSRHNSSWSLCDAITAATYKRHVFHSFSSSQLPLVTKLEVVDGVYGRQAVATEAAVGEGGYIPRGTILLREGALALSWTPSVTPSSPPTPPSSPAYRDVEDLAITLQPSHVELAWELVCRTPDISPPHSAKQSKDNHSEIHAKAHEMKTTTVESATTTTTSQLDRFMSHCRPPYALQAQAQTKIDAQSKEQAWRTALPTLVVMSIVACVRALLTTAHSGNIETETNSKPVCGTADRTSTTSTSAKITCERAALALQLYEVLRRLPHNTHAISTIMHTPDASNSHTTVTSLSSSPVPGQVSVSVLSQTSCGVGIFPIASALNHACNGNTIVKFQYAKDANDTNGAADEVRDYVSSSTGVRGGGARAGAGAGAGGAGGAGSCYCSVELVASRDILCGEELCMSYGPTPVMPMAVRKRLLWEQYLFQCQCALCVKQSQTLQRTDTQPSPDASVCVETNTHSMIQLEKACILWAKDMWLQIDTLRQYLGNTSLATTPQLVAYRSRSSNLLTEFNTKWLELKAVEAKFCMSMSAPCERHLTEIQCTLCDISGQVCALLADYPAALAYTQQGVEIYIHTHCTLQGLPVDDILVCREEVKVVQLLLASGRTAECKALANKVKRNMQPYVNSLQDPDYCDVTQIVDLLAGSRTAT